MTREFVLDTNWVLRYLLNDNLEMANEVESVFRQAKVKKHKINLTIGVVVELVYVLTKVYKHHRQEVSEQLLNFVRLSAVKMVDREVVERSLELWGRENVDFVDVLLVMREKIERWQVLSFDRDIQKLRKTITI